MTNREQGILRGLAGRVAEIAATTRNTARIAEWKRHNSLRQGRPMLLVFPEGSWGELLPGSALKCTDERARSIEWDLRHRVYGFERFATDNVVVGEWTVGKAIGNTGWGLHASHHPSTMARGAWAFDPVIKSPADSARLRIPEITYDPDATATAFADAQELLSGVLDVRLQGVVHVSFHLMNHYTGLRGLEQVMVDMCENPGWLHDVLAFLEEGNRKIIQQYVDLNLLSLNNNNTYHSSGGNGWTDELPAPGFDPGRVRPCDMWASAEAQELAQVSPAMHVEFALEYEKRLLAPFGLTGYGCCEDLTRKMKDVLAIPRIRRISVAPMADVVRCAEQLGDRAILSWKPDPTFVIGDFNEEKLRAYLARAVDAARANGCVLEMILKDTHTCESRPERFDRWTHIAREVVDASLG